VQGYVYAFSPTVFPAPFEFLVCVSFPLFCPLSASHHSASLPRTLPTQAWRVIFALVSLPLASSAIIYFINHRYDGAQLWDVKLVPGA
jgi:uncharacterized membrane protein